MSAEDGSGGATNLWRLITGTLLSILVATTLGGVRFAFDVAQDINTLQRDFYAMDQGDRRQDVRLDEVNRRLDRAFDRLQDIGDNKRDVVDLQREIAELTKRADIHREVLFRLLAKLNEPPGKLVQ